jgi:hypothetical protein
MAVARSRNRALTLADLPEELSAFRYEDWRHDDDAQVAAERSAPDGGQG